MIYRDAISPSSHADLPKVANTQSVGSFGLYPRSSSVIDRTDKQGVRRSRGLACEFQPGGLSNEMAFAMSGLLHIESSSCPDKSRMDAQQDNK